MWCIYKVQVKSYMDRGILEHLIQVKVVKLTPKLVPVLLSILPPQMRSSPFTLQNAGFAFEA
jgi:hypothetical protein